ERYLEMIRSVGYAARRQGVNGLHVHVGVASAEQCYERLEAVLPWLPVVLALSANSPFVDGEDTGMLSMRAPILAELPRAGAPPWFGSYGAWEAWVERLAGLGVLADYTRIWWDVRPQPRLGTLEVRVADQPTSLERTRLLAHRSRGAGGGERDADGRRDARLGRRADEPRRAALCDGEGRLPRARERLALAVLARLRVAPTAVRAGRRRVVQPAFTGACS